MLIRKGGGMAIDVMRETIQNWQHDLGEEDKMVQIADIGVIDAEKVLEHADDALAAAERGLRASRRALPTFAIGLVVLGVGIAVAIAVRKRRAAQDEWEILEQREDTPEPASMQDVSDGEDDASDLADAADAIDGEQG